MFLFFMNGSNVTTTANTAAAHYLNAVSAARSGDTFSMGKHLEKAFSLDSALEAQAKNDIEFEMIVE